MTLEERIQLLEDREAIIELRARYARHVVRGEGEQVGALFTEDGRFVAGVIDIQGRKNLQEFLGRTLQPVKSIPLVTNHVIEIEGDTARGTCTMYTPWFKHETPGFCGDYTDEFRKVDGRWLFTLRSFVFYEGRPAEA